MSYVICDFETASQCDLKKAGAYVYAEHPTTEVLCFGMMYEDDMIQIWTPGQPFSKRMKDAFTDPKCVFIAHNAQFEKQIIRRHCVPYHHWPDVPNSRWHDTQAVAAMKALPQKLEKLAMALRLEMQKDMEGNRLTLSLSKFQKNGCAQITPEKLKRVCDYNETDLVAEKQAARILGGFQPGERNVWLLDQRINERGIRVDLDYVDAAQTVVDSAFKLLNTEFEEITGGIRATQRDKLLAWAETRGVKIGSWEGYGEDRVWKPNLQKDTITELLGQDKDEDSAESNASNELEEARYSDTPLFSLPENIRRALVIRQTTGSASIKKLKAIRACVCEDGRARGTVAYHAAGPGRWAGRLFQPQNFPRGSEHIQATPEEIVEAIMSGDYTRVAEAFRTEKNKDISDPALAVEAVITGLRHAIIASPGRQLLVGDFNTIEARIVLALARQYDALEILQDKERDVYAEMASKIFGCDAPRGEEAIKQFKEDHLEWRQTGKNTVLGCGFQMGAPKFRFRYAKDKPLEFAKSAVDTYRKKFAPNVPAVWKGLEDAALEAVLEHKPASYANVLFAYESRWLTARLPSGRKLYYYDPQPAKKAMPWDETDVRMAWTCRAWKNGQWIKRDMYGGLLTENVVQALARDLLVHSMFLCEKNNLPIVLTVHDEIVAEPETKYADVKALEQIMGDRPRWAVEMGVPVATEIWAGERYRK